MYSIFQSVRTSVTFNIKAWRPPSSWQPERLLAAAGLSRIAGGGGGGGSGRRRRSSQQLREPGLIFSITSHYSYSTRSAPQKRKERDCNGGGDHRALGRALSEAGEPRGLPRRCDLGTSSPRNLQFFSVLPRRPWRPDTGGWRGFLPGTCVEDFFPEFDHLDGAGAGGGHGRQHRLLHLRRRAQRGRGGRRPHPERGKRGCNVACFLALMKATNLLE